MSNSRTKNSALTLIMSGIRQIATILLAFASRTVFIYTLGASYLGVNGLFTNILSILALSELGISGAIAFYLYRPLVDKDIERIKVLMKFYRQCYNVVGLAILVLGCCVMPFLDKLVNLDQPIPENLYFIYFLFLLQNASTYFFFAYKQTIVSANQELYKIEKLNIFFVIVNCITDIVVLLIFKDFTTYLLFKFSLVVIKNIVISWRIDKEYPYLKEPCSGRLTHDEKKKFFKDLYSISIFRLGSVLFNTLSNFIISIMIGTVVVGYFSNYTLIVSQVQAVYMLIMSSITAGVGNVLAKESRERQIYIYDKLSILTFFVYAVFTVCLFQLLNSFMNIWLGNMGEGYVFNQWTVLFICFNFYVDMSCQLDNVFRGASGNFKIGRYLQIWGGLLNVCLAIPLCKFFGLTGIFAAQVLSKLVTSYFPFLIHIENLVLGFSSVRVMKQWAKCFSTTVFIGVVVWILNLNLHQTNLLNFVFEIILTLAVSIAILYALYRRNEYFVEVKDMMLAKIKVRKA